MYVIFSGWSVDIAKNLRNGIILNKNGRENRCSLAIFDCKDTAHLGASQEPLSAPFLNGLFSREFQNGKL